MVEDSDAWNNGVGGGSTARIDGETEETCIFQSELALGMNTQELYHREKSCIWEVYLHYRFTKRL
jgi:hypothetical protein